MSASSTGLSFASPEPWRGRAAETKFSKPDPPPSLMPEEKTISFGFMLLNSLDGSAEFGEALVEALVAAVYRVHIEKRRFPFRRKHADEEDGRGTERGRRFDIRRMQLRRAVDVDAVRVGKKHAGAEFFHFHIVDSAVLVHPVMDERAAFGLRRDRHEERKIVYVDARIRARGYFLGRRGELRGKHGDIGEYRAAILGGVLGTVLVLLAHLSERHELQFEKVERATLDGYFRLGRRRKRDEEHGFYRIFARIHFYIPVVIIHTVHDECRGPDTLYLYSAQLKKNTEVLHHVIGTRVLDDGLAGDFRGRHEDAFRPRIARFVHGDFPRRLFFGGDSVHTFRTFFYLYSQSAERLYVRHHRASAEIASARKRQFKCLEEVRERRREKHRAPRLPRGFLVHFFGREFFRRVHDHVAAYPLDLGTDASQYFDEAVGLFYFRHMLDGRRPAIQERCGEERHRGILRDVGRNRAGELSTADDFVIHQDSMPYFALVGYEGLLRIQCLHFEALCVRERSSARGRDRTFGLPLIRGM